MKISREDKSKLRVWMQDDGGSYDTVIVLLAQYIADVQAQDITGENEFQTLRALHLQKGKVDGAKEFFDEIERQING